MNKQEQEASACSTLCMRGIEIGHGMVPLVDSARSGWTYDIWELDHDAEVAICEY